MNVAVANKCVSALNRIAEGAAQLASVIEECAWEGFEDHAGMPGDRPIAAVQLAQPTLDEASQDDQAATAGSELPGCEPVSLEQIRGVLAELSQAGYTEKVRQLIQAAGAEKLSEVSADRYAWLLEQAEAIGDE